MNLSAISSKLDSYTHWERLRRLVREPVLDRSGVALFSLLGGLLLLAGRADQNQALARLGTADLAAAMAGFLTFFLTWLPGYVLIALFAPRIYIDYENQEKFIDSSLRTHSREAEEAEDFRSAYVEEWHAARLTKRWIRCTVSVLIAASLAAYAISLVLAVRALAPFAEVLL